MHYTVLMALIDVASASDMYQSAASENRRDPGLHATAELQRLRRGLSDEIDDLERSSRERLAQAEAAATSKIS